ncbi:methyltransferase domain-containing protein [Luteithermobacter gelatinilyticus]|uniref:methyltransferase domain-containing protein n=1 Tax=Luteithermobacter gelatinilyticus TaxID=2582913 RepID=UPI001105BB4A|nr:methyltransferase domain-containing protein [Luteithermobacter gelatinilyticus]|tara:strand:- start:2356 stop:3354 length:999 start_codon:yes stop_codon:yes gene_type:complete
MTETAAPENPLSPRSAQIFDRRQVRRHRDRAAAIFDKHDFLFREVADRLYDKLLDVNRSFERMLDLGCHRGELAALLNQKNPDLLIQQDLSLAMLAAHAAQSPGQAPTQAPTQAPKRDTAAWRVQGDEEFLPYRAQSLDLITSNLSLHWVNDLPGTLLQIRQALRPDGLFLAALFGGETLTELRQAMFQAELNMDRGASPHVSPFVDVREAGTLLQRAGFALPVVDTDRITVTYKDALALMMELRGMGETNALVKGYKGLSSAEMMMEMNRVYRNMFSDERGRITVTFEVLYLLGWAPHESQPKPLKPGSAKMRLADALGVKEHSAGEKAGK